MVIKLEDTRVTKTFSNEHCSMKQIINNGQLEEVHIFTGNCVLEGEILLLLQENSSRFLDFKDWGEVYEYLSSVTLMLVSAAEEILEYVPDLPEYSLNDRLRAILKGE